MSGWLLLGLLALLVGVGIRLALELTLQARRRRAQRTAAMLAEVQLRHLTFRAMQAMLGEVRRHQSGGRDAR